MKDGQGPVTAYLENDHARIEDAFRRATISGDRIEPGPYAEFRQALLRHIGIEEKILFPPARIGLDGKLTPPVPTW